MPEWVAAHPGMSAPNSYWFIGLQGDTLAHVSPVVPFTVRESCGRYRVCPLLS